MDDPIPPPPAFLKTLADPIASSLSLPMLPLHVHEVLAIFALYTFVQLVGSPYLARRFLPQRYASFSPRTRVSWHIHVVALVQAVIISGVALWVLWNDRSRWEMDWRERVWGYTGADGLIVALAVGYFLWDLGVCALHIRTFGVGMLAHAAAALAVYSLGFRPLVNNYAPNFILYELSSPFLNIHWCCDKLNLTGSRLQLVNGVVLLTTFLFCRLIWGPWQSFNVTVDVIRAYYLARSDPPIIAELAASNTTLTDMSFATGPASHVPLWLVSVYVAANVVLNFLNFYWFTKMITAIRKRFTGEKSRNKDEGGVLMEEMDAPDEVGTDKEKITSSIVDGLQVVEVEKTEIRKRKGRH